MKFFLYSVFFIFLFLITGTIIYLSTIGFETSKFNNLIIEKVKKKNYSVDLDLKKIKIKLDLKKFQLFLSTKNPKITYLDKEIPVTEVKIYSKINKFFNPKIEIKQIFFSVEKLKIYDIKKIITRFKPSNFKNYLLNNIDNGEIEKASINLKIDKDFNVIDHKVTGTVKKINAKIKKNFIIKDINFNFITDKNLTLINSFSANYEGMSLSNGSVKIQQEKEIEIKGKFDSLFYLQENQLQKLITKVKFFKDNKIEIQGSLLHVFNLRINKNFKIIDYNYKSSGDISRSKIILKDDFKNTFIKKPIKKILFEKTKIEIILGQQNKNLLVFNGFYSFDDSNYKKFKVTNNLNKVNQNYLIDLNLSENVFFDVINYQTSPNKNSNIKVEYNVKKKKFIFKSIDFIEEKNTISVKGLIINSKNEIEKISSIRILTFNKKKENNNFIINFGKKISIVGKKYDSSNLLKLLSESNKSNPLKGFNKEIEVQIKDLITKSNISLSNFNLIGSIKKGKFNRLSAKGEFEKDKYLDITLKEDLNNKQILEIYSDAPQALLGEYKFFEGIGDGKLLYNSTIDDAGSDSKLTIENFKVTKAPAFATLLTLADLGGFVDLLSGQGMSFDILEINFKDDNNITTIDEILALGSSVSLHMDGYIEKKTGLVSLRGTLVPAKALNSLVSKIPVIGKVLIGNKVGEGVFGVSFKMKGLPGKIKTTINPVKTITPRFITRALEKIKKN